MVVVIPACFRLAHSRHFVLGIQKLHPQRALMDARYAKRAPAT
jgi:hypothetical protein